MRNLLTLLALAVLLAHVVVEPARTTAPAATRPRVLFVGDSIAQGLYASDVTATAAARVAAGLGADLDTLKASTVYDARQKLSLWDSAPPRWIVVILGHNDSLVTGSVSAWAGSYGALLDDLVSKYPQAQLVAVTLWPGAALPPSRAPFRQAILDQAQLRGWPAADLLPLAGCAGCLSRATTPSPFPPGYRGDGWHPSDEGHRQIARVLLRAILSERAYFPEVGRAVDAYPAP